MKGKEEIDLLIENGIVLTMIDILAETGTAVSHNPEANAKISEGIAPVSRMLEKGVTISIGTDTVAANDNMDLFEAMRFAGFLQKVTTGDPKVVSAPALLHMGTLGGARALGMENKIGSLEEGKAADIILLDINTVNMQPVNNVINNIVYCASASSNVDTVIVDGDVIIEGKKFLDIDEKEEIRRFKDFAIRKFLEEGIKLPSYY